MTQTNDGAGALPLTQAAQQAAFTLLAQAHAGVRRQQDMRTLAERVQARDMQYERVIAELKRRAEAAERSSEDDRRALDEIEAVHRSAIEAVVEASRRDIVRERAAAEAAIRAEREETDRRHAEEMAEAERRHEAALSETERRAAAEIAETDARLRSYFEETVARLQTENAQLADRVADLAFRKAQAEDALENARREIADLQGGMRTLLAAVETNASRNRSDDGVLGEILVAIQEASAPEMPGPDVDLDRLAKELAVA